MSKILIGVFGAGGLSREILPVVRESFLVEKKEVDLVFVDKESRASKINGIEVVDFDSFNSKKYQEKMAVIAIAESKIRERLFSELRKEKIALYGLRHPSVIVMDEVEVDEGYILSPYVTLTSNIKIGKLFQANIYSYVAHDCIIGDYVTFAPNVHCNGNVIIEDHAYIGTGAILKQGTEKRPLVIGAGAVVGMGAVVTRNVDPGAVVIGNPAKPLTKESLRRR